MGLDADPARGREYGRALDFLSRTRSAGLDVLARGGWSIVGLARLVRRLPVAGLPLTSRDDPRPERLHAAPRVNSSEFAHDALIWSVAAGIDHHPVTACGTTGKPGSQTAASGSRKPPPGSHWARGHGPGVATCGRDRLEPFHPGAILSLQAGSTRR